MPFDYKTLCKSGKEKAKQAWLEIWDNFGLKNKVLLTVVTWEYKNEEQLSDRLKDSIGSKTLIMTAKQFCAGKYPPEQLTFLAQQICLDWCNDIFPQPPSSVIEIDDIREPELTYNGFHAEIRRLNASGKTKFLVGKWIDWIIQENPPEKEQDSAFGNYLEAFKIEIDGKLWSIKYFHQTKDPWLSFTREEKAKKRKKGAVAQGDLDNIKKLARPILYKILRQQ